MVKNYWALLGISVISLVFLVVLTVLCIVFAKKIFFRKRGGIVLFSLSMLACIILIYITSRMSFYCIRDYNYTKESNYIQVHATVVEFTSSKIDYDGNGKMNNSKPKLLIEETNEYIVLNLKDVELGQTYYIRYLPHTKLCEIIK